MNPKVFVSHASEDKNRFVLEFGEKLRHAGIDAWIDKWEIMPGDSFVDKIFEEGIKNAQAIIVILSKASIQKRWVREELNVSIVKKLATGSKLIPIIIDNLVDAEIPESLKATQWVRIDDLTNYEKELRSITNSILGLTDKPSLGELPIYKTLKIDYINQLSKSDSIVLRLACELAITAGDFNADIDILSEKAKELGIDSDALYESLAILASEGYIDEEDKLGDEFIACNLTAAGFEEYCRVCIKEYEKLIEKVGLMILNNKPENTIEIGGQLDIPKTIIKHICKVLNQRGFIEMDLDDTGEMHFLEISPKLRRAFKN